MKDILLRKSFGLTDIPDLIKKIEQLRKDKDYLIKKWAIDLSYIDNLWASGKSTKEMIKDINQILEERK